MMTTWQIFTGSVALVAGVGVGAAATVALFWLMQNAAEYVRALIDAAARYGVRNEVVTEYYDQSSMERVKQFSYPTFSRVKVAKRVERAAK